MLAFMGKRCAGVATWHLRTARPGPGSESGTMTAPRPPYHPGWQASRTLGTAGALAASGAEAGAAHSVAGCPGCAVTGVATVQSEEAGRAGCGGGVGGVGVTGTGQVTRPVHTPGHPAPAPPHSPRSQKVPLQPAGQVQAPLTWSQAPPCSHWQRCPQPSPKWPWGHPGDRAPPAISWVTVSTPTPSCLGLRHPSGPRTRVWGWLTEKPLPAPGHRAHPMPFPSPA